MLSLTPEIMAEWARSMGALVDRALAENPVRWIPEKAPARRSGIRVERKDGLLMPLPEPVQFAGECPGGRYVYVADPALAVRLLGHWTEARAWAAVDLETSAGYRMLPGPDGARTRRWSGSDPFTSRIMLASVSVEPGTAVVFDMRGLMQETSFVAAFGRFLAECPLVVHNAGFEYGFFRAQFGVEPSIAYDTLVAHQMLTAGLKEGSGLDDVLTKYTGAVKEKKWQKFFIEIHPEAPIPNAAIAYSAGDVCLLLEVAQKIDRELFESGQYHIWTEIERPLMRWIHHASQVGVTVDADLLRGIQQELAIERDRHRQAFEGLAEGVLISSPAQLLKWFNERSPAALLTTERESFEELMLKVPNGTAIYRAAEAVLGFRGAEKLRSTYIEPYLGELVNPQTGKIHPRWKQASTATGRMACSEPNLMNIPSKGRYVKIRNAIVAPEGFTFAWLDYSQYEVRAIADESGEQRMIAVFEEAAGVKSALAEYVRDHALPHTPEGIQELAEKSAGEFQALVGDHPELGRLIQRTAECDFHRRTASLLFRVPVNQVTKQQRADAKCFHPDTEVLTRGGWRRIESLAVGEEIVQAVPGRDGEVRLEWVVPLEVFKMQHPSGQLVHLLNQGIDLRVTPDHRMLGWNKAGEPQIVAPQQLSRLRYWANAGELAGGEHVEPALLRLAVATQADGSYQQQAIRFGFTRERKIVRMRELLEAAGLQHTSGVAANGVSWFRIWPEGAGQIKALLDGKSLPWDWLGLSPECRQVVLDEVGYWDGTQLPGKRLCRVSSTDQQTLDVLQALGALTRRKSRLSERSGCPNVSLKDHALTRGGHLKVEVREYDGEVACLAVPSTFVLVRDQGVPVICGQTVTFGLPYGAGPKAIAKQAKRTIDEARKLLKDYQREFPEVGKFLERCRAAGRAGMTKSAGGRIRRYEMPYLPDIVAELQKIKAESETDPQRWADLLVKWRSESLEELAHQMHQAKVRSIEREATNHPIQANNADATKLATVLAGPQLAALHPECAIMMWVHDEIVLMAPTAVVKEAARILEQCMLDAARRFIRNCPVDVSVSFGQRWGK
jgi:DNA polymerase I-like protein with 3'-5' exonuclease and polymerase domains